jgi:hypothetical protein
MNVYNRGGTPLSRCNWQRDVGTGNQQILMPPIPIGNISVARGLLHLFRMYCWARAAHKLSHAALLMLAAFYSARYKLWRSAEAEYRIIQSPFSIPNKQQLLLWLPYSLKRISLCRIAMYSWNGIYERARRKLFA